VSSANACSTAASSTKGWAEQIDVTPTASPAFCL